MKAIQLATIQVISFVVVLLTASSLFMSITGSILFFLSFTLFVTTAIYIAHNHKQLEVEIDSIFEDEKKEE